MHNALYSAFSVEHLAVQVVFTPILSLGLLSDPRLFRRRNMIRDREYP